MNFSDILNLFHQGKGTARSHMKNLIEMAAVDGKFDEIEYDLLKTIAKRNGISESQLAKIRQSPGDIQFQLPPDKKTRFDQLYDLVHMMTVDKSIHDEELNLCNLFAVKFEFKRDKVKEIIDNIRSNIQNGQGHDQAFKRLEWML